MRPHSNHRTILHLFPNGRQSSRGQCEPSSKWNRMVEVGALCMATLIRHELMRVSCRENTASVALQRSAAALQIMLGKSWYPGQNLSSRQQE